MGDGARYSRYSRVVPNSHFWTDLEQILVFFEHQDIEQEYLLTGLENTVNNGYDLMEIKKVTAVTTPYFLNINTMVKYVNEYYNKGVFLTMLKNTINNGIDLMEVKNNLKMERKEVYRRVDDERDYQDLRWTPRREKNNTPDAEKPPAEWLNYIEYHLNKAKDKVYMLEDENALAEVRKIAALAVRCLELHGCPERIIPEDLK